MAAAFLCHNRVFWKMRAEPAHDNLLRSSIRLGYQVHVTLVVNLHRPRKLGYKYLPRFSRRFHGNLKIGLHRTNRSRAEGAQPFAAV